MADYHYVSTWQLQAPIEQVWAAITDLEHLPAWYAGVEEARELALGDAQGVGSRVRYVIKGRLPLRLVFEATITWVSCPAGTGVAGRGELWNRALVAGATGRGHHRPLPLGCGHDQAVDEPAGAGGAADVHLEQQRGDASGGRGLGGLPGRSGWWVPSSLPRPGPGRGGWAWRSWQRRWCGWWVAGQGRCGTAEVGNRVGSRGVREQPKVKRPAVATVGPRVVSCATLAGSLRWHWNP